MNGNLIFHLHNCKVIYNLENNKYYKYNPKLERLYGSYTIEEKKLRKIGEDYDWSVPAKYKQILDKVYKAHSMRYHYRLDLHQTPSLPETSLRRALVAGVLPKDIILIGDDDLVSVPLALMGHNTVVLDTDEYLLKLIDQINEEFGVFIKVVNQNLFSSFSNEFNNKFDILYTDPISTYEGFKVFIGKGVNFLRDNGTGLISINQRFRQIFEQYCLDTKLIKVKMYRNFSNYYNHRYEVIDDISDLYEIKICKNKKIVKYPLNEEFGEGIFKSQSKMKYFTLIEFFGIKDKPVDKTIEEIINILNYRYKVALSFFKKTIGNIDFWFLYSSSNNSFIKITWNNENNICFEIVMDIYQNIGGIRKSIKEFFQPEYVREEQYVIGIPGISSKVELDINCL